MYQVHACCCSVREEDGPLFAVTHRTDCQCISVQFLSLYILCECRYRTELEFTFLSLHRV